MFVPDGRRVRGGAMSAVYRYFFTLLAQYKKTVQRNCTYLLLTNLSIFLVTQLQQLNTLMIHVTFCRHDLHVDVCI